MCGIFGYTGSKEAQPLILQGLKQLEYRGYDSSGIAVQDGMHTLEVQKTRGKIKNLEASRIRYDNIALALTLYPILIFYFTLICAPIALGMVIWRWNAPRGLAEPSRAKLITAAVIALLEIAAWVTFFIVIFSK